MNKKYFAALASIFALVMGFAVSPAKAVDDWATGLTWNNLHVKSESGVFENFHREWKVEKPGDLFSSDHIDLNSPTQHNQAWVRTDRNSYTTTYSGGVSQANKTIIFILQGYNADGNAMDFTVSSPAVTAAPQPVKVTVTGGQTYRATLAIPTDGSGNAEVTATLKSTPVAFDSIITSIATKIADVTPSTKSKTIILNKKTKKKKTVTSVTYAKAVNATKITAYEYALGDSENWLPAPASPFDIAQTTQTVKMRAIDVIGPQVITWQEAGWRPIIKLWGVPGGRTCNQNMTVYLCTGIDIRDQTFDWSVANRPWFKGGPNYDYAQAYSKTYTPGSTVALKFFVRDIWGTPIANLPLTVALNGGASVKWNNYNGNIRTDAQGFATFTALNKNTVKQVTSHVDINPDPPHVKTKGVLGFVVTVTSNQIDEVADLMWFQMVGDITIAGGCPNSTDFFHCGYGNVAFPFASRGPNVPSKDGNYWLENSNPITNTVADGQNITFTVNNTYKKGEVIKVTAGSLLAIKDKELTVDSATATTFVVKDTTAAASSSTQGTVTLKNPDLTLDPAGTSLDDVIIAAMNIARLTNKQNIFLWAPEVKITATNGGLSAVVTADQKANGFVDFKDSSRFSATTKFGFTYYQDLVFMATNPGTTTWTVSVGKWSYSFSQNYVAAP